MPSCWRAARMRASRTRCISPWTPRASGRRTTERIDPLDTETRKHDIRVMKNVTITLPDDLARKARVEAAKADKSLSRFIADMLAERCKGEPVPADDADKLGPLREFFYGPGYPGISK